MKSTLKDKVILIVEDIPTSYLLILHLLKQYELKFIWAKNGQEAVDECEKNQQIELVLMDVRMPIMNGLEATKKITVIRPDLPIIIQTAYDMQDTKENAIAAGCIDYILKPINVKTFPYLISKYLT
jgi:CheY-like chemotaxis protein